MVATLLMTGCGTSLPHGVIKYQKALTELPGPLPGIGPFQSRLEALMKACPFLLALPNAVASSQVQEDSSYDPSWYRSTEYCAWLYYTTDKTYEMSWVATPEYQMDPGTRRCALPISVRDDRHPREHIQYVSAIHTHPIPGNDKDKRSKLSEGDIKYIIRRSQQYGSTFKNSDGTVNLAIIAFFRRVGQDRTICNNFYEYAPATGELQEWALDERKEWQSRVYGRVKHWWNSQGELEFELIGKESK